MKKLLALTFVAVAAVAAAAPEFKVGSVENPTAIHIQRTMKALEESTAEKPATVRVLFYGQSIVRQGWTDVLMKMLKEKRRVHVAGPDAYGVERPLPVLS